MEALKEKIPMIIVAIIAIAILVGGICFFENYEAVYYTKIDNTKIKQVSSSDEMKYQYTLDCYDKDGNRKEFSFKTSRELKEDAYLLLEIRSMGVHAWKEVQYYELPDKVKEIIQSK